MRQRRRDRDDQQMAPALQQAKEAEREAHR